MHRTLTKEVSSATQKLRGEFSLNHGSHAVPTQYGHCQTMRKNAVDYSAQPSVLVAPLVECRRVCASTHRHACLARCMVHLVELCLCQRRTPVYPCGASLRATLSAPEVYDGNLCEPSKESRVAGQSGKPSKTLEDPPLILRNFGAWMPSCNQHLKCHTLARTESWTRLSSTC